MACCIRLIPGVLKSGLSKHSLYRATVRGFQTSQRMSEEQIEELKKNPFFDKYAHKIAKLQDTSPEEFLARLSAHEDTKKEPVATKQKDFSLPGRARAGGSGGAGVKTLDKVVKLELLKTKEKEKIAEIWTQYFKDKDSICAVIPADTYKIMQKRFKEFGTFLFPLPRQNGYEFVMVQFQGNEAHFTTLINFQAHHENAPECLSLVHYTELMDSKGIVLMAGEYDKDALSIAEAKCLADEVEIYYSRPSPSKLELLRKFTYEPAFFHHNDLIKEINTLSI
ncbi:ATP synthase mitochondrial F1 complex assembly factor 1 isoform X2 [Eurytemora carolleeae]|uniref:ATP synthase mitochondrial F1 complex assembly factor 1 isoform X2 n=1 Tax=Eurytemora carolleeae TaxID=1294199 RepID=UPI000C784E8D|nr:ATP synthase mitochondrial F1 complex assembly factor 1 isoform X2 [Eurytemora carolleeae]|eukprot:XP_023322788.1 ATP synthase mitochondrial F1 complex assembly factor 1-like isoform X2 [Eurytemora affinis]